MLRIKRITAALGLCLLLIVASAPSARAACDPSLQTCSTTYGVNEAFFGTGGQLCIPGSSGNSINYCAKSSAGETSVGASGSTAYKTQAGFNTDREPSLTFIVNATNINLGVLNPGTTATATATFSVKSYLSSGYVVQTMGNPPTYSGHQITPLSSGGASNPAQEQFGINLVANTLGCSAPANFGANPSQVPDSTYSFGATQAGYNTCGSFKYNNGDIIAYSNSSSGETDYTISYILNTTSVTPAGTYIMNQSLVATATF